MMNGDREVYRPKKKRHNWLMIPVILLLGRPVILALKDYQRQRAEGKDPVFRAAEAGVDGDLEFWK